MATVLAHIRIKPGTEEAWEAIMRDMVLITFKHEEGMIRYEFWKGEAERSYYCLSSFRNMQMLYDHLITHYDRHRFEDIISYYRLEHVGPVEGAGGGLPLSGPLSSEVALLDGTTERQEEMRARHPLPVPGWWEGRK